MKDEEMADKHAEKYFGKSIELVDVQKIWMYKHGFLAGLKAGRPQWHDLRKDPNDLPKKLELGTCSRTVVNQIGTPCHYNYELQCWLNWSYIEIETPIAWCEIPTFDKE